ncbi:hypothetical protein CVD28_01245 [Bacillus sp. M6-12]|uniref:hypothetical protein n=1 Tax=Bacillus sp. M6-12 TaxID=2054166 RepID=UPI000C759C5A|nr:hypothetical protein [Bacillus sp. M6-12]PLS19059.1 hypothetical protein CVD28_01245 [Bacillus sp. M6-12]
MRLMIDFEESEIHYIKKSDFEALSSKDIPVNKIFFLCDKIEDQVITPSFESDCHVLKKDNDTYQVQLTQMERRKFWDAPVGLDVYMNWKKKRIQEMQEEGISIYQDDWDDDGDYIHLGYYIDIQAKNGKEVIEELVRLIEINIEDTLQLKIDKLMDFDSKLDNRTII